MRHPYDNTSTGRMKSSELSTHSALFRLQRLTCCCHPGPGQSRLSTPSASHGTGIQDSMYLVSCIIPLRAGCCNLLFSHHHGPHGAIPLRLQSRFAHCWHPGPGQSRLSTPSASHGTGIQDSMYLVSCIIPLRAGCCNLLFSHHHGPHGAIPLRLQSRFAHCWHPGPGKSRLSTSSAHRGADLITSGP